MHLQLDSDLVRFTTSLLSTHLMRKTTNIVGTGFYGDVRTFSHQLALPWDQWGGSWQLYSKGVGCFNL